MAEISKNLDYNVRALKGSKIGIAVSRYNSEITEALLASCRKTLTKQGVDKKDIRVIEVPGAFELPYACQTLALTKNFDAIITLGAVIRGDTPHFDYVALAATKGVLEVSLKHHTPVIFGVLTTNNLKQAFERIQGGKRGDKGVEAALTALHMINLNKI